MVPVGHHLIVRKTVPFGAPLSLLYGFLWDCYGTKSLLHVELKVRCKHHNSIINVHWVMLTL